MKISGEYLLPVSRDDAYTILQDPAMLARAIPGCETLEKIADNEYHMKMKMVLASMSGLFDGKVRIADPNPVSQFRLIVDGAGKIGFMKGDGLLTLTPADGGTNVHYDGSVEVGGTIAGVGQRLLDTTAKMLIKRFFTKLNTEVAGSAASSGKG